MPIQIINPPDDNVSDKDFTKYLQNHIRYLRQQLGRQAGLIVVLLTEEDIFYATSTSENTNFWHKFNSETEPEDPFTHTSAKTALKTAYKFQEINDSKQTHEKMKGTVWLALWAHPDLSVPLDKYLKITGSQFPGSPTA